MNIPFNRSENGVCSKDWSWIRSSLTTPGIPSPRRCPAAPGPTDGIKLLDEPDGAPLTSGVTTQGLEVGPDLPVGLAVEHRLERRRGHEEEWHPGLGRHRLGHVGLAGARWALEEDRLARRSSHLLGEPPMGQEEVERLGDFFHQSLRPADVVKSHLQLVGAVEDVRRASGCQQRHDHHQCQDGDEGHGRQQRLERRREVGRREGGPGVEQVSQDQQDSDRGKHHPHPLQSGGPSPLLMGSNIGGRHGRHTLVAEGQKAFLLAVTAPFGASVTASS